jgi:hypothetical protein
MRNNTYLVIVRRPEADEAISTASQETATASSPSGRGGSFLSLTASGLAALARDRLPPTLLAITKVFVVQGRPSVV